MRRAAEGRGVASDAVAKERVRVVTDPLGRPKRRLNFSAMHQVDDASSVERRRDEAVDRLRQARRELLEETSTLSPDDAFAADRWGPLALLWHLGAGHTHIEAARAIVEQGALELPERDARAEFEEAVDRVVRNIDEAIAYSLRLGDDELTSHARRMNRDYYVIGFIETTAEHALDHVDHIRQIKARLVASA
jgi:hypothetical protein